jgi:hypothetical protein
MGKVKRGRAEGVKAIPTTLRQVDDDIATTVEDRCGLRRHNAGRVILLDDTWPLAGCGEIGPPQHRGLKPTDVWPEIRPASGQLTLTMAPTRQEFFGDSRALGNALADHLDVDDLDRLLGSGAMAICTLVLLPKRLYEVLQSSRI